MPEIKNTFLAGKMNKSLDDRIIPQGEYRDALNVQITKAEGPDVGVIHNIEGNDLAHTSLGLSGYYTIGSFFDERDNIIYWFVTNNGTSNNSHRIYKWDKSSGTATMIVQGAYLNFHKDYKITGVNLLEELLFWTDNRNQPRRINITRANGSYYDSEEKVSVAKIAPWQSPSVQAGYDATIQSNLLEEEFVRFSYRYKFRDNEYSLLSPFSQICFEMGEGAVADNTISESDENKIFDSTENFKVVNRANKVDIEINLMSATPYADYEISAVDVLYKESDSTAIRIIDTIKINDSELASDANFNSTTFIYTYTYNSTAPKSTLPEGQLTRAFDNVPIKALSQEVVGNRVVYGNFTQNYNLPDINYDVYCTVKNDTNHPHHSVKQRRNYEVGIVLVDKYGRTSPVILSDSSRITVAAKHEDFDSTNWLGDSFKVVFNNDITGTHVYGDSNIDPDLPNDLGWYYYRIVVKQTEQEYYNVYNPGISRGYITLHNDNINKVPRNTDDSFENDNLYPTDARLYPKLINYADGTYQALAQKLSNESLYNVESIGTAEGFDIYTPDNVNQSKGFYEQRKFHLLGKLESGILGNVADTIFNGVLSVFETEPFESTLDIYYETSTSGVIQDLNDAPDTQITNILFEPTEYGSNIEGDVEVLESAPSGSYVAILRTTDANGNDVPGATFTLNSSTTQFEIEKDNTDGYFKIKTRQAFAFDPNTPSNNEYTLNITANFGGYQVNESTNTITITNAPPTISGSNFFTVARDIAANTTIFTQTATNGSADIANNTSGLTISHTELDNGVPHSGTTPDPNDNIFNSSISNGVITVSEPDTINASHHGHTITVQLVLSNGTLTVEKSVNVYISNTTGNNGLTAIELKFEPNENQYTSTLSACQAFSAFTQTVTVYADAADASAIETNSPQIYRVSTGEGLAADGWYADPTGSWTGQWILIETSNGNIGYWGLGPTSCTT